MKTAYPNTQTTCSIRLYSNIPFDNTYKHHTLLSNKFKYNNVGLATGNPKERFLDRRQVNTPANYYYPRYDMTDVFNFDFTNGLIGSVVLSLTPAQTNANYMRLTCGTDVYYYFITGIMQVNYDTYKLNLELDVIMTYQDEFLDGMKDVPVFTKRKHDHQTYLGAFHSEDYKSIESTFANATPTIIQNKQELHFEQGNGTTNLRICEGIIWAYVCCDAGKISDDLKPYISYKHNGTTMPLVMVCVPINGAYVVQQCGSNAPVYFSYNNVQMFIQRLINAGWCYGCKLSHYPPFTYNGTSTATSDVMMYESSGDKYFWLHGSSRISTTHYYECLADDGNRFIIFDVTQTDPHTEQNWFIDLLVMGGFIISEQNETEYSYTSISIDRLNDSDGNLENITSTRATDPKLMFAPFSEYTLMGYYDAKGYDIRPETRFSDFLFNNLNYGSTFTFRTFTNGFIGDNGIYTYLYPVQDIKSRYANANLKSARIGLNSTFNYTVPCGTDALAVFNATQRQSFETSKVASGITSGLQIVGGIASIIGGGVATASGVGVPMAYGMFSAGFGMIASGTAGIATTITSSVAKYQDLANTPDSINVTGSSFIMDNSIEGEPSNGLPYLLTKVCDRATREKANDFFYDYGYEVVRCCYFNEELKYDANTQTSDVNLFTRCIFNYIEIQDDITNKINADIPYIIKKKLSEVFNSGITLWTFFGFKELYKSALPNSTYDIDKWLLKNKYNNSSYTGSEFPII